MKTLTSKQRAHSAVRLLTEHSSRKTLLVLLFVSLAAGLFAFPGVTSLFPTASGQYVYYRDYTFPEETYIGFLQYDEGTYAIRYFSPVAKNGALPIIEMYLTVNPDIDYVDITGEKINSPISQNDTEIMNYMHDLLYEFGARRHKLNDADFYNTVTSSEEFMQFGGDVTIDWNFFIPIFNLSTITSADGDILLEAVTMGTLKDNNDQSFVSFCGMENLPIIDEYYISSIEKDEVNVPLISVTDGLWAVGDIGVLTSSYSPFTDQTLSEEDRILLMEMFTENAWQVLYISANSYYSIIDNMYLPYTDITINKTDFFFRTLYSDDIQNFSDPHYIIIGYSMKDFGFETKTLLIPMNAYWANADYYNSLVK